MKALVTGGAGFIGSTLVDRLLNDGHSVFVIDNLVSGSLDHLASAREAHGSRLEFRNLDIRDFETVDVIASAVPDVIFHLAAQIDVRLSVARAVYDAEVNIAGTLNVLEGARNISSSRIVFASSGGAIYGDVSPYSLPADEQTAQKPLSPYGVSKKAAGDYLALYQQLHGLEYVTLALSNVYGPRQGRSGEAGVVSIFGGSLAKGHSCTIYGDGRATRDYVYVDDVVDALMRSIERGSGLYNVGTGIETSTLELYETMAKVANVAEAPTHAPERRGEIARTSLNPTKARHELEWVPETPLADGIKRVLDFFRD